MRIADEERPLLKRRPGHFTKARLKHCYATVQFDTLKILGSSFTKERHRTLDTGICGPTGVRNWKAGQFERALDKRHPCNGRLPAVHGYRFPADLSKPELAQRLLEPVLHLKTLWIAGTPNPECDDAPYPGEHLCSVRHGSVGLRSLVRGDLHRSSCHRQHGAEPNFPAGHSVVGFRDLH